MTKMLGINNNIPPEGEIDHSREHTQQIFLIPAMEILEQYIIIITIKDANSWTRAVNLSVLIVVTDLTFTSLLP